MANEFIARKGLIVLAGGAFVTGNLNVSTTISSSFISGGFFHGNGAGIFGVISSSYAITSSYADLARSASFATTASAATSITFTPATASYAITAGATGGGVTGQGVVNRIVVWTGTSTIATSSLDDDGSRITTALPFTASAFQGNGAGITGVISASYAGTDWGAINNKPVGITSQSSVNTFGNTTISGTLLVSGNVSAVGYQLTASAFQGNGAGITGVVSSSYALTASYAQNAGAVNFSTGSYTGSFTGSLLGSASFATTASAATSITFIPSSASFATTASAATSITFVPVTASHAPSALSASYALTARSSSYAVTTDWSAINNRPVGIVSSSAQTVANIAGQTITPLIVSATTITADTITARVFNTQMVSSSIIYQSGSTKFGDTADDVMSVTGSLNVSGSTTFLGPVTFNSGLGPSIIAGALYTTASTTANVGTTVVGLVTTGSYDMAQFAYVVKNGARARSGVVMSVWSASVVEFTDTSTADIGDTTDISFTVDVVTGNARLKAVVASINGWTVKAIVQAI